MMNIMKDFGKMVYVTERGYWSTKKASIIVDNGSITHLMGMGPTNTSIPTHFTRECGIMGSSMGAARRPILMDLILLAIMSRVRETVMGSYFTLLMPFMRVNFWTTSQKV